METYLILVWPGWRESSANNPYLHELLERDNVWLESYKDWLSTSELDDVIAWVHGQWFLFHDNMESMDEGIDFLQTPSSKGLVLYFRRWEKTHHKSLILFRIFKRPGFKVELAVQVADIRVYLNNDKEERLERYYLNQGSNFLKTKN
ncbi:MAG: hypothetical protein R2769_07750 [Saprospiraceae bacterium]